MRVYLSSTFEDLVEYRAAAAQALHRLSHQVIQMENYVSAPTTPLLKVVEDVRTCDVFIGIYAWKRGSIPTATHQTSVPHVPDVSLGQSSYIEWELAAARHAKLTVLLFLLHDDAPWPPHLVDGFEDPADQQPIRAMRESIRNSQMVSFFRTPGDLEQLVATSIAASETTRQLRFFLVPPAEFQNEGGFSVESSDLDAITEELGNITQSIATSASQRTIKINLSTGWWSTRLFLLAFMSIRLNRIRRILITETRSTGDGPSEETFVGLLPTETAVSTLGALHPILRKFASRSGSLTVSTVDVNAEIKNLLDIWHKCFPEKTPERKIAHHIRAEDLSRWFGHAMLRRPLPVRDVQRPTPLELALVMNYPHDFVPIVWQELPEVPADDPPPDPIQRFDVVEQAELSKRISQRFVNDQLGRFTIRDF